jgi:hypothetical protein
MEKSTKKNNILKMPHFESEPNGFLEVYTWVSNLSEKDKF